MFLRLGMLGYFRRLLGGLLLFVLHPLSPLPCPCTMPNPYMPRLQVWRGLCNFGRRAVARAPQGGRPRAAQVRILAGSAELGRHQKPAEVGKWHEQQ